MNRSSRPSRPRTVPARGTRRSLSSPGGRIDLSGDAEAAAVLRAALAAQHGDPQRLTHGFHSYPARMHPDLARVCLAEFSRKGEFVLDPFCGSGTVLVEAMVGGRVATGVDLNPIAVRIARVQCELRDATERDRFVAVAAGVVQASLARVRERVPVKAPLSAAERAAYEPHVLLELAGLRKEIAAVELEADRQALEVVFTALLVKFSRQRADTSAQSAVKRIRKGLVSEFFERKAQELAARWSALRRETQDDAGGPRVHLGDARELPQLLGDGRFDLVLSSPPYGGTYDYHAHHARRYPWLGIDAGRFQSHEVGARRRLSREPAGAQRWEVELSACLRSIAAITRPRGLVLLLLGDAQVASRRIDAGEQLTRLGQRAGLSSLAIAAQHRVDPAGGPPRREHLVLLQRGL